MAKTNGKNKSSTSTVTLPREMELEFNKIKEADKALGFGSYREFVKDAVRNNILKYRETELKYQELEKKRTNDRSKNNATSKKDY